MEISQSKSLSMVISLNHPYSINFRMIIYIYIHVNVVNHIIVIMITIPKNCIFMVDINRLSNGMFIFLYFPDYIYILYI